MKLLFTLFLKKKPKSTFLNSFRRNSAIPLSFFAFPVYVGSGVEVLWRQKTFWNVEKKKRFMQIWSIASGLRGLGTRGRQLFFSEARGRPLRTTASWSSEINSPGSRHQRATNICGLVRISVCTGLCLSDAYRSCYVGGVVSRDEQLGSQSSCCAKHLSWLPGGHRVKYPQLDAALTFSRRVLWRGSEH